MFMYETHDYMDMKPETNFRTAESQEVINQFIEHMRTHWCSGTVSDAKEVTPSEYLKARQSDYWKGYEEALDNLVLDCTQEWYCEYHRLLHPEEFCTVCGKTFYAGPQNW